MSDLIEFLKARLDEDEAAARAAWGIEWSWRDLARPFGEHASVAHTAHIARHDPARVLREVAAKRAILADYGRALNFEAGFNDGDEPLRVLELALRHLAAVYSDHPDYRDEWKP